MTGPKKRKAHRVPKEMGNAAPCKRCGTWFDTHAGAAARGDSWYLHCATCRERSALARKRRADLLPPGALLDDIRQEMARAQPPVTVQNTFPFQIQQELAHLRKRKLVRPVDGKTVTRPQLYAAWESIVAKDS